MLSITTYFFQARHVVRTAWLFSLTIGAILLSTQPALAWCRITTAQEVEANQCTDVGIPICWQSPIIRLAVDAGANQDISQQALLDVSQAAFNLWVDLDCENNASPFTLELIDDPSLCQRDNCSDDYDGGIGCIRFKDNFGASDDFPSNTTANTCIWRTDQGTIVSADIFINNMFQPYETCIDGICQQPDTADLFTILAHEFGHALGLGHSDDMNALMYPELPRQADNNHNLKEDDRLGFCSAYDVVTGDPHCISTTQKDSACSIAYVTTSYDNWYKLCLSLALILICTWSHMRHKIRRN